MGNLSDRFGRRKVLLASLAAMAVDYVVMAMAGSLWLLFFGRLVAGIAGATYSTANAYMADISAPEEKAKNFGLIGAAFGIGFIVGPLIGGAVGELGTRAPFYTAAGLAALNFIYGSFVLPESLAPDNRRSFSWSRANPFGVARQIARFPAVAWLIAAFFLYDLAHHVYPVIWSFFAKEAFGWRNFEVGLSLTAVGVGFTVVQGFLIGPIMTRFGAAKTAIFGIAMNVASMIGLGFASAGWVAYAIIPFSALGAVTSPALTSLMSNHTAADSQGELQGALASIMGITLIISPIVMSQLFGYFTQKESMVYLPGAPFIAAALLTGLALVPMLIGLRKLGQISPS